MLYRGSERVERKSCDCFRGFWSLVAVVLPTLDWEVIFYKEHQELCKGQRENSVPTMRPDSRDHTRNWAQRRREVALRSFVWHRHPTWMIHGGDWGGVHLGCSLQPTSDLEAWGLISSQTWDQLVSLWCFPFPHFLFLLKPSPHVPFPNSDTQTRLPFVYQTHFLPLEIFLEYLWGHGK